MPHPHLLNVLTFEFTGKSADLPVQAILVSRRINFLHGLRLLSFFTSAGLGDISRTKEFTFRRVSKLYMYKTWYIVLCDLNSYLFVVILRYLGSKGRTKQAFRAAVTGHVHWLRPPKNTCRTGDRESKTVVKLSSTTSIHWFCFFALQLLQRRLAVCKRSAHVF